MMSLQPSDYWVIAGIALLIGEMLSASFFLVFLSLGAFAASLAAAFNQPFYYQLLVCAGLSVVGMILLRKPLQKRLLKASGVVADIGREIVIDQAIAPHKSARIAYQGSQWTATNVGIEPIVAGERVVIVGMDGVSLLIRKIN